LEVLFKVRVNNMLFERCNLIIYLFFKGNGSIFVKEKKEYFKFKNLMCFIVLSSNVITRF